MNAADRDPLAHTVEVLRLASAGAPLVETLQVVAGMAAACAHGGAAVVMLEDGLWRPMASSGLTADQSSELAALDRQTVYELESKLMGGVATVKPLVTSGSELVGVLVADAGVGLEAPLFDRVAGIATLAIELHHFLQDLSYRADHDPLTGLWNRARMERGIESALAHAKQTAQPFSLLLIDFDRFSQWNDVLGQQIGNEILRLAGMRLMKDIGSRASVARMGGDEFLILLPGVVTNSELLEHADRLRECLEDPFLFDDHELLMSVRIGVAVAKPGDTPGELLAAAATAARYAKLPIGPRVAIFDAVMRRTPPERLEMEQCLRRAQARHEFQLYYQPQIHLDSGEVTGVEALLRWRHPVLGFISPATFVPVAEDIGLIEAIGAWALQQACRQAVAWSRANVAFGRVAVNVSSIQFSRPGFAAFVASTLETIGCPPEWLELEITESILITDFELAACHVRSLRATGVVVSIDDFGTGHSSLVYLKNLPVNRIKIDRTFVQQIGARGECPPLLSNIVRLAHALGVGTVAEGIETVEQFDVLRGMGCETAQGFYMARPLTADSVAAWIRGASGSACVRRRPLTLR